MVSPSSCNCLTPGHTPVLEMANRTHCPLHCTCKRLSMQTGPTRDVSSIRFSSRSLVSLLLCTDTHRWTIGTRDTSAASTSAPKPLERAAAAAAAAVALSVSEMDIHLHVNFMMSCEKIPQAAIPPPLHPLSSGPWATLSLGEGGLAHNPIQRPPCGCIRPGLGRIHVLGLMDVGTPFC